MDTEVIESTTINLSKVCRVCLIEYDEMHSIFSEIQNEDNLDDEPTLLYEILMHISSIRILAEDSLPSMICTSCMELAHAAYKFQQQCNRSQEILEAFILHLQAKTTEVEISSKDASDEVFKLTEMSAQAETNALLQVVINDVHTKQLVDSCVNEKDSLDVTLAINSDSNFPDSSCVNPESLILKHEDAFELNTTEVIDSNDNNGLNEKPIKKEIKVEEHLKMEPTEEKTFECNLCGKTYKHANSLKIHVRTHTMERPYTCNQCGKGFKQYGALNFHLRSHTGEQPYACKICGKRYRQSGTLTAHMRVHTGQRPFLCSVCGRGFRQAPDLGYHMRTHTKERPYMCNVCGKTMRMQCHLVQHMRMHTGERPFVCIECNKAFPSSTRLKRHAIIHTGLKPFTCEVCKKSFNRLSSLRVHSKIHTDERPHVCAVCSKGFIQAHALRSHMNTHSSADDTDKSC